MSSGCIHNSPLCRQASPTNTLPAESRRHRWCPFHAPAQLTRVDQTLTVQDCEQFHFPLPCAEPKMDTDPSMHLKAHFSLVPGWLWSFQGLCGLVMRISLYGLSAATTSSQLSATLLIGCFAEVVRPSTPPARASQLPVGLLRPTRLVILSKMKAKMAWRPAKPK